MTPSDEQLVQTITQQVLAALGASPMVSGANRGDSSASSVHAAEIHAPAGTCTGDYSKFKESPVTTATETEIAAAEPASPAPMTGIITATQLQQAMSQSPDGVAVIAVSARLTPLANDLARQNPGKIRRASPLSANPGATGREATMDLPWLWWIDGVCPVV
ncbi:MAG: hypothetical protein IT440_10195, partial [Phycisphaeraceae bacterium]|nr:hypothetical protein [Phycisphaeraceae bacterium]